MKDARNSARHRDGVRANTEGLSPAADAWSKREPLLLRALEPRILLDAAGAVDAMDVASGTIHGELADAFFQPNPSGNGENDGSWAQAIEALESVPPYVPASEPDNREGGKEIAFVAAGVEDAATLIASLGPDVEVVLLSSATPGISQIAESLSLHSDITAVHIFGHGTSGALSLGGEDLTVETMSSIYAADLASIGGAMSSDGDILIYGCDFASGEIGQQAARTLAQLTGADVAASDDVTGHEALGGDWDLEHTVGEVEARVLTAGTSWFGTLANVNSTTLFAQDSPIADVDNDDRARLTDTAIQTFTYDSGEATYEIDQIDLALRYVSGSTTEDVWVSLKETLLGPNLGFARIPIADLDTTYDWHSAVLDVPAVFNSGQEYLLIVSTSEAFATIEAAVEADGTFAEGESAEFGSDADMLFRAIDNTINSAPEFTLLAGTTNPRIGVDENQTDVAQITASDADGDTLTFSIIDEETPGTFAIDPSTGELSFITPPDFENPTDAVGQDNRYNVTVQVSDGQGGVATKIYVARVDDVDEAPVIDGATTGNINVDLDENQTAITTISAIDPEAEQITYSISGGPSASEFTIDAVTGGLSFIAPPDFENPTDTDNNNDYGVRVRATDPAGNFDERLVVVTVRDLNEAPVATADAFTVDENDTITLDVVGNDVDEDGDALTITEVNGSAITDGGAPVTVGNGTVSLVGGQLVFAPTPNYSGPASFSYVITDGNGLVSTAFVNGTVNSVNVAPNAQDDTVTVLEDSNVNIDVLDNDSDPDNDALTIVSIDGQAVSQGDVINVDKGTVRLVGGRLLFTPDSNETGPASFTYTVEDEEGFANTATVNMSIVPVNDAPIGLNILLTMPEDATVVFDPIRFEIFDIFDDPENRLEAVIFDTLPQFGSLKINGVPMLAGQRVEAADIHDVTYEAEPNATSASTPGTDYTSFTFRVVDDGGTDNGGENTDPTTSTFTIRVLPVNDTPEATDNSYSTAEDTAVNGNAIIDTSPFGADSDVDGDALTLSASSVGTFATAAGGAITLNGDGSFTYQPPTNFNGNDSFDYTVTDGTVEDTARLLFSVAQANDPPVAVDNDYTLNEDAPLSGNAITDVSAGGVDSDVDGDALTLAPASVGTFATVEGGTITLNGDGSFTYQPLANFNGTDSFDYTITDGFLTETATLTFTVAAVNDAPVATKNTYASNEDEVVTGNAILDAAGSGIDSDSDGDALTLTASSTGTFTTEEGGTITLSADGSFTYSPLANFSGTDTFQYRVTDGNETDTAELKFNITAVNDDPVSLDDSFTVAEGQTVSIDVVTNDTDPEGSALDVVLVNGQSINDGGPAVSVTDGSVSLSAGRLLFTPDAGFIGATSFTYTVSDGSGGRGTATVSGTVLDVNEAPIAQDNEYTTIEDSTFAGNALTDDTGSGVDSDPDGTPPIVDASSIGTFTTAQGGSITMATNGDFTYRPAANFFGTDSFDYTISDGLLSDTATLRWEVSPVNDAPEAADVEIGLQLPPEGEAVIGNLLNDPSRPPNVIDVDGDIISVDPSSIGEFTTSEGGTVVISANGEFKYTPRPDYSGKDEFTVTFTDGIAQDTAIIFITEIVPPPSVDNNILIVQEDEDQEEEREEEKPDEEEEKEEEKETSDGTEELTPISEPPALADASESPAPPPKKNDTPVALKPEAPVIAVPEPDNVVIAPQEITRTEPVLNDNREPVPETDLPTITPAVRYQFQPIDRQQFTNELKRTRDDIKEYDNVLGSTAAKVTFGFGAVLGVGSVTWILQSGVLAATLLSALPAWKRFDPIGVVSGREADGEEVEDSQSDIHVLMQKISDAGMRTER